ncbi:MAG: hypothetical protein JSS30_04185 [Verrucomicrobia bacterium]|nr:hypothetical protein [Verrucomicrobiota bacterium]
MKKILIYRDEGTDQFCIHSLLSALKMEKIDHEIQLVDSSHLRSRNWQTSTSLVIIPGGRDIPYHQALQGLGNQNLKEFVQSGGKYFGICAGAYYGSGTIEFERGGPLEVLATRELKFFPGIARGPAYGPGKFSYQNEQGAQIARLISRGKPTAAYFNGGCSFVDAENFEGITVLARYADIEGEPAGIIHCAVGAGEAILCGVHPEHTVYPDIETERRALFQSLLHQLL